MCTHESESATGWKCLFKTERTLKVTGSYVHSTSGNMSEMVEDSHCYYRPLTESDTWPIKQSQF